LNIPSSKASFNEQALTPGRRISECQEEWKRRSQKGVRVANKQLFSLSLVLFMPIHAIFPGSFTKRRI